jgi:hypothetical protein
MTTPSEFPKNLSPEALEALAQYFEQIAAELRDGAKIAKNNSLASSEKRALRASLPDLYYAHVR